MTALLRTHLTAPTVGTSASAFGAARTTERLMAHGVPAVSKVAYTGRNGGDVSEDSALGARSLR